MPKRSSRKSQQTAVGIVAQPPISIWNRDITCDFASLFKSLASASKSALKQDWTSLTADAISGVSTIGLDKDPPGLAWALITRSLTAAVGSLFEDSKDLLPEEPPPDFALKSDHISNSLAESTVQLNRSFFARPESLDVVAKLQTSMRNWLEALGMKPFVAASTMARLPAYFTYALHREWKSKESVYSDLRGEFDSPFSNAADREFKWQMYSAYLMRLSHQRVFSEPFGIREVYIPLRASFDLRKKRDGMLIADGITSSSENYRSQIVDLREALEQWVNAWKSDDSLRIISGGPGSGKSTAVRILAADWMSQGRVRVVYIPLHLFDWKSDLVDAVSDHCKTMDYLYPDILDVHKGEPKLLIIFDGLDELSKQGKLAAETAQSFVREVQRTTDKINAATCRLHILICGRPVAVQGTEADLRKEEQILHLVGYFITNHERFRYKDPLGLLEVDQRNEWWRRFGRLRDREYHSLPKALAHSSLDDVTTQPLLNYLVALTYEREQVDFSKSVSLNVIYADLLAAVYERAYEHRRSRAVEGLSQSQFERVLEEIALATWHGNSRTTTVKAIKAYCEQANLSKWLDNFADGAESGITRLLTAFYFRQAGNDDGERTFEFTHKSFGEFLTARRLVRASERICKEVNRRKDSADDGWSTAEALVHWAKLCGYSAIDVDLFIFIDNEYCNQPGKAVDVIHIVFTSLLSSMIKSRLPIVDFGWRSLAEAERFVRNVETCLLAVTTSVARIRKCITQISWTEPTAAGNWLKRLIPQRSGPEAAFGMQLLCFMDFGKQMLDIFDFYDADIRGTFFKGAELNLCQFGCAQLDGSQFDESKLWSVQFHGGVHDEPTQIQNVSFRGCMLTKSVFEELSMFQVDFSSANLNDARFRSCHFTRCDFSLARKLTARSFSKCRFDSASLHTLPAEVAAKVSRIGQQ